VTSYNVIVVFDLASESKYRFTMYPNPDSLIEYPLSDVSAEASHGFAILHMWSYP